jgi:hypothetical protein
MLEENLDSRVSAHVGEYGVDWQLAISPRKHVGLMLNHYYGNESAKKKNHNFTYTEGGVGAYNSINNFVYDCYLGLGAGSIRNGKTGTIKLYDVNNWGNFKHVDINTSKLIVDRYFIQPSVGYKIDVLHLNVATRLCYLKTSQGPYKGSSYYFEPAITAKINLYRFSFQAQYVHISPFNNKNILFNPNRNGNLTVGINFKFINLKKHKKVITN